MKNQRDKRTQKSQHTRDNRKNTGNKAPDSQTSQAICRTHEINRAHRSHSTREAKQNKTHKNNKGLPIKTIKLHDSIPVPAGFAPAMAFPTHTYKCVGDSRSRKSRLVVPRRLASSSSMCQEVMNFPAPCNTPLCHGAPSSIFASRVHTALSTPNVSRLSTVEPRLAFLPSAASGGARRVVWPWLQRTEVAVVEW